MTEEIGWRDGWEQIKTFMEKGSTEIINTGYKKLDDLLGSGLIKGSTNLVIEDSGCIGDIFLVSLLKKRVEFGDIGVIDCFFISPEQLKEQCRAYNIDLDKYDGKVYYLDFSSKHRVKSVLGSDALDTFAKEYTRVVSELIQRAIYSI
ncbi:MAG: ATPase domain-containing protein [Candidatus Thermoplasmatota archaeon]|nr:ATPase domain-containing protein [Candidatus Thermoplasmatota archaeon]